MNNQLVGLTDILSELRAQDSTSAELAAQFVNAAQWALEQAHTLDAVKDVKDHVRAAEVYFEQRHATLAACNLLSAQRIRCEWRLGYEILRIPRAPGTSSNDGTRLTQVLNERDIPKSSAYRWQILAQIDPQDLEHYFDEMQEKDEITTAGVLNYFTAHVTIDPRDDAENYDDGDNGAPPDQNDEMLQVRSVTITCRHCGTKDIYEI